MLESLEKVNVNLPSDREIMFSRFLEAPRHLVFEAWTKPEHIRNWWGCNDSTLTVCDVDLRLGGEWRFVMKMPDGSEHPFMGVYREIKPPERLVYSECYDEPKLGRPEWLTTVVFAEHNEGTLLTCSILHKSREYRDGHLQSGMEAGMIQSFDQLAKLTVGLAQSAVQCGTRSTRNE